MMSSLVYQMLPPDSITMRAAATFAPHVASVFRMTQSSNTPPARVTWSQEARTVASLLLFVHLFAVVVTVTAYTQPSLLQQRLDELFDPYLRNLHLTALPVSYPFARYHLTHALPSDVDFTCRVQFDGADGEESVVLPPPGLTLPIRTRRYQRLVNAAGALASSEEADDAAAILPKAIGGSILRQNDVSQGSLTLTAHFLPELEDMPAVDDGERRALENYSNVYEADVLANNGQVDILKKSETLEVAPSESSPPGQSAPPAAPGSE